MCALVTVVQTCALPILLPTTEEYVGDKLITRIDGKRVVTPLLLALIAIGFADVLFALDSLPAIYGLTQAPYLVFTANAFALMGLRQLYFLDRKSVVSGKGVSVRVEFGGRRILKK